jgi:hypothetical protein
MTSTPQLTIAEGLKPAHEHFAAQERETLAVMAQIEKHIGTPMEFPDDVKNFNHYQRNAAYFGEQATAIRKAIELLAGATPEAASLPPELEDALDNLDPELVERDNARMLWAASLRAQIEQLSAHKHFIGGASTSTNGGYELAITDVLALLDATPVKRCLVTGNPCGTDTVQMPCACKNCLGLDATDGSNIDPVGPIPGPIEPCICGADTSIRQLAEEVADKIAALIGAECSGMEAPIESALTTLANQMIPRLERSDDPEQDEAFRMNKPEGYVLMTPEAFEMNNLVIRQKAANQIREEDARIAEDIVNTWTRGGIHNTQPSDIAAAIRARQEQ